LFGRIVDRESGLLRKRISLQIATDWEGSALIRLPFQALLTPLFLEMHSLGLLNSLVGLALFYTTFNLPFGVFVMRNTFLQIPWELSEAAAVDGASTARTLLSVLRPLVVPGIATTVLYAFLFSWTEFVGALTSSRRTACTRCRWRCSTWSTAAWARWTTATWRPAR
jgi:ABC-type glycerol-3-phosphate transport system permease component